MEWRFKQVVKINVLESTAFHLWNLFIFQKLSLIIKKDQKNCKCSPILIFIEGSLSLLGLQFSVVRNVTILTKSHKPNLRLRVFSEWLCHCCCLVVVMSTYHYGHISQSSQVTGPLFENVFIWSCLCLFHCSLVIQFMSPHQMSQRSQVSGAALSGCFLNCLCCCLMSISLVLSFFYSSQRHSVITVALNCYYIINATYFTIFTS